MLAERPPRTNFKVSIKQTILQIKETPLRLPLISSSTDLLLEVILIRLVKKCVKINEFSCETIMIKEICKAQAFLGLYPWAKELDQ